MSALSDEIFRQVEAGIVTGASIATVAQHRIHKGDVVEIPECEMTEWSLTYSPAQRFARIIEVGGKAVARPPSRGRQPIEALSFPSRDTALRTLAANAHLSGAHHVAFVRARNEERALRQAGLLR